MRSITLAAILVATAFTGTSNAQPAATPACEPGGPAVQEVSVGGQPFIAVAGADGCTVFASLESGRSGGVAVLKYGTGGWSKTSEMSLSRPAFGMALTNDGAILAVAEGDGVTFLDTARLTAGSGGAELGHIDDGGRGAIYVAVTPDDRLLFVSDERSQSISVIDLLKARASNFVADALIGRIGAGNAPVGLAFSADGRALFATAEVMPWPDRSKVCQAESAKQKGEHFEGALLQIDVDQARSDPSHALIGGVPAGCNPVRVALSPSGDRVYVTARDSNALLVFDTGKSKPAGTLLATIAVGTSPVGVVAAGNQVIVTNSNRFGSDRSEPQTLTVIDAAKIGVDADPTLGSVEVGAFPRNLTVTADGKILLVANATSQSVTLIRLADMPIKR